MSIRVEFIRRRAGGRITVRPTVYEKNEVTLGRATDCDVYLPDLRVGLQHARILHLAAGKARVEARSDYQIRINGASVRRRDVMAGDGSEVRIGPYRIELSLSETAGELLVSIELVEPVTTKTDKSSLRRALWKSSFVPPKRPTAWMLAVTTLSVFLVLPLIGHFNSTTSPGPIAQTRHLWLAGEMSSVHANLVQDCAICHTEPFVRVRDEACLSCHTETRNHADAGRLNESAPEPAGPALWTASLKAALDIPEERCGSCHFEHDGQSGVRPIDSAMCADCHMDLSRRLADTPLHDVSSFARHHPEFKPTIIVARDNDTPLLDRISLAQRPREDNGLKFPHDFHLKNEEVARKAATLSGAARARVGEALDCGYCHKPDAAGAMFLPVVMETACADCHSLAFATDGRGNIRNLPHGEPQEVRRVLEDFYLAQATTLLLDGNAGSLVDRQLTTEARARRERLRDQAFADARRSTDAMIARIFSEDGVCQKCHVAPITSVDGEPVKITPVVLSDVFMPKARFSHAKHTTGNLSCASCHEAERSSQSSDVLLPGIAVCRDCHAATGTQQARLAECLTCHAYHGDGSAPLMHPAVTRRAAGEQPWAAHQRVAGGGP